MTFCCSRLDLKIALGIFGVHMPAALSEVLTSTTYNYGFYTDSEAELGNRRLYCPRGGAWRLLVNQRDDFVRGNPATLTVGRRAMAALDGVIGRCSHTSDVARIGPAVIHYFVGWVARNGFNHRMCRVSLTRRGWLRVLRSGFPSTEDFNGAEQEGFGPFDASIADGRRQSTAVTYLDGRSYLD